MRKYHGLALKVSEALLLHGLKQPANLFFKFFGYECFKLLIELRLQNSSDNCCLACQRELCGTASNNNII